MIQLIGKRSVGGIYLDLKAMNEFRKESLLVKAIQPEWKPKTEQGLFDEAVKIYKEQGGE